MCYYGDKIKDDEMGGASNKCGGEDKGIQNFGGDIWRKETTWKPTLRWKGNIKMDLYKYDGCVS